MKKKWSFLFACITCLTTTLSATEEWVTYEFSGGRFGDNLLAYLHAKWFAFEHHLSFLYRPFKYSDQLKMDWADRHYSTTPPLTYRAQLSRWPLRTNKSLNIIYRCPYFPDNLLENTSIEQDPSSVSWYNFPIDWENPQFRQMVRELISPKEPLPLTYPPNGPISIAVHIRQGGGYDTEDSPYKMPMKLPPLEFYIEGIQTMLDLFPGKPLYCYLFTDAQSPETLAEKIFQAFPTTSRLTLDYRRSNNQHDSNVLEDFFSLFEFDALIHPISNFSLVAARIHDYAVTFAPRAFSKDTKKRVVKITKTDLKINHLRYRELLKK
jgi:hypothetical protein